MAARTRVDFEVRTGGEVEPTPGVRLGIHETSTAMQQVDGWVQGPDGRSIYLRKHPVREPVLVYSTPEGRHYELVLTQVGSSSTEGYLLVPAGEEPVRAAR